LVDLRPDGSFKLNQKYFTYTYGLRMAGEAFEKLFGFSQRSFESPLQDFHFDVAASIQKVCDEAMLRMARRAYEVTRSRRLCLAGGVALNCVSNGRILREGPFKEIFIQPAAGDAGGAYGVASFISHALFRELRVPRWGHAYTGPHFTEGEVREVLDREGAVYEELRDGKLLGTVARKIAEGRVVGWVQGSLEFGPRALGHRSILADPRDPQMKDKVNLKIKFRETFRPFAPVVLEEECPNYFGLNQESPFMLFVAPVLEDRRVIPSVTHVDGSARIQTINRDQDDLFYDLILEFKKQTGVPVIINTSFNVRGEPIVCTPEEAWHCFMRTQMDDLIIGPFLLDKSKQKRRVEPPEAWLKYIPPD
jgi:carbamoyltransferase